MLPATSAPKTVRPARRLERDVREQWILRAARELFLREGWDGFSIEGIAEQMNSSRSLVYAHFPSKEEILLALAIESKVKRLKMLDLALQFEGRARERLVVVDLMELYLVDSDLPTELMVTSARLRAKTTEERQKALTALELRLHLLGAGIVREAIGAGDLKLPRFTTADELYFTLWSSVWGAVTVQRSDFPHVDAGVIDPTAAVRRNLLVMLDGFGWCPLSREWDYRATCRRAEQEIFSRAEFQQLIHDYELPIEGS